MTERAVPLPDSVINKIGEQHRPFKITLLQGNLIEQDVNAIVNAANTSLLGGGGVDGQIHRAAGDELYNECKGLGGCQTGDAKITGGYNLRARHVIHAVGPRYPRDSSDEAGVEKAAFLLSSCYRNILRLARENELKSIAIPAISTGIFGYPQHDAAEVVRNTIFADLQSNGQGSLEEIRFVLWGDSSYQVYDEVFSA